jgi:DNA-binding response OmpR family regulator
MVKAATILLVEDDVALQDGISDLLEVSDLGYAIQVMTASDGREGLDILENTLPDLVISDITMPRMGGFEFLQHIRDNPAWVQIPVIFLTARGTRQDVLEGRRSGAELYITKPYESDELMQLVRSQLDRTFELQNDHQRQMDVLSRNIVQLLHHEFRTPLTYVTAYSEMLAEDLSSADVDTLPEYLRGIQAGTARLSRLIEDLVQVLELRTGEAALKFKQQARPINNLSQLLTALCQSRQAECERIDIKFNCQISTDLPPIFGEPDSLVDICDRLLDNAVKFSRYRRYGTPEISMSTSMRDNEVLLNIKDNGIGFPERVQSRIFDLFFQFNREKMEQQGAGAGLAIVKGVVDLHGGKLTVQSREGVGSEFTIAIPMHGNSDRDSVDELEEARKQATVLLVEDEWYLLEGLRDLLETIDSGYELGILTALNGRQGLEVLARNRPDLIVSDIMMPHMDGYEFLRQVRQNPAWVHIPFIFLTAKGERHDVLRGRRSGVEEYITKPYNSMELFDLIVAVLDRHFEKQGSIQQDFEELKRGVLGVLLQDFRSPLTNVSDYSQKLSENIEVAQTDAALTAYLQGILAGSSRVNRLVEDFIYLAELRTGEAVSTFDLRARPANISALLQDASQLWLGSTEHSQIQISYEFNEELSPALLDTEAMTNCIERLMDLTMEQVQHASTPDLFLSSFQDNGSINIRIGSRSSSLSEEIVEEIETLLSLPEPTTLEWSGFEPGLSIAKGTINLHGGRIRLKNIAGRGFAFEIRLPAYLPAINSTV